MKTNSRSQTSPFQPTTSASIHFLSKPATLSGLRPDPLLKIRRRAGASRNVRVRAITKFSDTPDINENIRPNNLLDLLFDWKRRCWVCSTEYDNGSWSTYFILFRVSGHFTLVKSFTLHSQVIGFYRWKYVNFRFLPQTAYGRTTPLGDSAATFRDYATFPCGVTIRKLPEWATLPGKS